MTLTAILGPDVFVPDVFVVGLAANIALPLPIRGVIHTSGRPASVSSASHVLSGRPKACRRMHAA